MAIITLTTDFGYKDHYVSLLKASIYRQNPGSNVVDISHDIDKYNIANAAFVLNSVFREFPKGTVHLIAVNSQSKNLDTLIAAKVEEHYFVCADNGFLNLVSDKSIVAVEINHGYKGSFPEKEVFSPVAVALSNGKVLYDIGKLKEGGLKKLMFPPVNIHPDRIHGCVIYIDYYGNCITNIKKSYFEQIGGGRRFTLTFGRVRIDKIYDSYSGMEDADCVALFNASELLEIAIIRGHASDLLGLQFNSPIWIEFAKQSVD